MTDVATELENAEVMLQPDRQVTLPAWVCDQLGIKIGDHLVISVHEEEVVLSRRRAVALNALREIQRSFAASGISEEELQEEGQRVRAELHRAQYGAR